MRCFTMFHASVSSVPRAEHVLGEFQRMNLVEAKLRQAVALKNDVIDELKDTAGQPDGLTLIGIVCTVESCI